MEGELVYIDSRVARRERECVNLAYNIIQKDGKRSYINEYYIFTHGRNQGVLYFTKFRRDYFKNNIIKGEKGNPASKNLVDNAYFM